jgi:hypothetical protein
MAWRSIERKSINTALVVTVLLLSLAGSMAWAQATAQISGGVKDHGDADRNGSQAFCCQ